MNIIWQGDFKPESKDNDTTLRCSVVIFSTLIFFYPIFWGNFFFHTIILKSFDWWTSEKKLWKRINSYTLLWPWPIVTIRSIILWTMLSTHDSMDNIFLSKQASQEVVLFKLYFSAWKCWWIFLNYFLVFLQRYGTP